MNIRKYTGEKRKKAALYVLANCKLQLKTISTSAFIGIREGLRCANDLHHKTLTRKT